MPLEKQIVLIAEDNPGLARVLAYKFHSCGFDPITCASGSDAWKSFCDSQVAAIVSDHEMPIMSGLELIQRVREMDAKLPCFLVTGRQLELARDPRVIALGVQQVFGKPFSPGTVVSAVADAINLHKATGTSPYSAPMPSTLTGLSAVGLPEASA